MKKEAFTSASKDAQSARAEVNWLLRNKPFYLPLTTDESRLLASIAEPLSRHEERPTPAPPTPHASPSATSALVTLTAPVVISLKYGTTTLQQGTRYVLVSRNSATATIIYAGEFFDVPLSSTDLR